MILHQNNDPDFYEYPAKSKTLEKIQERVQKHIKKYDFEKSLEGLKDFEKCNAIFSLYGFIAYEEGYRVGLKELKKENPKIKIKRRTDKELVYVIEDQEEKSRLTKLVQERIDSENLKMAREEYCLENRVENSNESAALSITIHTFYEAGYIKATLDVKEMFKNMYSDDPKKAQEMAEMFTDLFQEVLMPANKEASEQK